MQTLPRTLQRQSALPLEIWHIIFRLATYVPGLLDVESVEHPRPTRADVRIAASSLTKRCIVQVCRMWRALGIEFFSEYLCIWGPYSSKKLSQLLELFKSPQSWERGRWTKHIHLGGMHMLEQFGFVCRLLNQCHHIEILRLGCKFFNGQDNVLARLLERRFAHSLRKIDYYDVEHDMVFGHPTLPDIPLLSLTTALSEDLPNLSRRTIESLSTLTLDCFCAKELPWYFPALRHLHLPTALGPVPRSLGASFIERHRETLVSLALNDDDFTLWIWPTIMCTRVSVLQIPYHIMPLIRMKVLQSLPKVTHLAIWLPEGEWEQLGHVTWGEIFECVVQADPFPNVQVVKLANLRRRLTDDQPELAIQEAAAKCWQRGIRLEDGDGDPIRFPVIPSHDELSS